MSIGHKSSNAQLYRLMVYRRALHPELFDLQERQTYRHGEYEVEAWLTPSGHIARFQIEGQCLTEAVIESGDHLPEHGLVHALPCLGEKDFELEPEGRIKYVTTVQTESLTDNLFMATLREMRDFAELYAPSMAFLPIGDRFTMGPEQAAIACRWLQLRKMVPIHWGTFSMLTGTPAALRAALAASGTACEVVEVEPGVAF